MKRKKIESKARSETPPFFFGLKVQAPWPLTWPGGRLIEEKHRHYTLAFLGNTPPLKKEDVLLPSFSLGACGVFTRVLFLPKNHPHVVAWEVAWLTESFKIYQSQFCRKLEVLEPSKPHVTVCRSPTSFSAWKEAFYPLPLFAESLHLYESLGFSQYRSMWEHPFVAPFEELEHTADIAFLIRGEDWNALYINAFTALSFHCPEIAMFWKSASVYSIEDIVMALNRIVTFADTERGCSLKAVSFHGQVREKEKWLEWEMIVDI